MKRCPQCGNTYSDENLFCLEDGTPLQQFSDTTHASLSDDTPTVFIPSFSSQSMSRPVPVQRQNNWLYPVAGVLAGLAVFLGLFAGLIMFYKLGANDKQPEKKAAVKEADKPAATPLPTAATIATAAMTPAPAIDPAAAPAYLSPQTRVRFGKGKVSANVSGLVPPGADRSLVLACRAGQYLSASVSSPGGCVTFANGSGNVESYTVGGDNFLYIRNKCAADGSFNMTVFIK